MANISIQKIPKKAPNFVETLALFCFYFPQYSYKQAKDLPAKFVYSMLSTVNKEQARIFKELTLIVAAPYSKRGENVKKMLESYREIMEE